MRLRLGIPEAAAHCVAAIHQRTDAGAEWVDRTPFRQPGEEVESDPPWQAADARLALPPRNTAAASPGRRNGVPRPRRRRRLILPLGQVRSSFLSFHSLSSLALSFLPRPTAAAAAA